MDERRGLVSIWGCLYWGGWDGMGQSCLSRSFLLLVLVLVLLLRLRLFFDTPSVHLMWVRPELHVGL
ncbi:hypothetical protein P280DRAFT_189678 [Massarina eburnea CBS 473.64]|uniref:Uncharacterized protein n=1 Tax=Massarina eburnea CBS 473.64 TaxID=1395130 RepID=A0A6A6SBI8_9PLEO|nr:hypothetical protein P280DRAFT_189678 [Massarina eburnea CBS 473.64]